MPTGGGIEGQPKTGHLSYGGQRNPTKKTGRKDGTEGGQKSTGHLDGPGGGGISRPSGKNPVMETQGKTGVTSNTGGGRRKGQGENNPPRTDEIKEI